MKIVIIAQEFSNNGGAEKAALEHYRLLMRNGNEVSLIGDFAAELPEGRGVLLNRSRVRSYAELRERNFVRKLVVAARGLFDIALFVRVLWFLRTTKPDVAHLHKVKQLSPLLYLALRLSRVPAVATIHDHYLTCLNSTRIQGDGTFCQLDRCSFNVALRKRCVGNSRLLTAYSIVEFVGRRNIVRDIATVGTYVFPSKFLNDWTQRAGYPINALVVPNFANGVGTGPVPRDEGYVLYFGRLSEEKGVGLLPEVAQMSQGRQFRVVGEGPLRSTLQAAARSIDNLHVLGPRFGDELSEQIAGASIVLLPSICFENAPLTILEAFMHGKPVIASDIGGIPELITPGVEGFLFPPGDCAAAAALISSVLNDAEFRATLGSNALASFSSRYNASAYLDRLKRIYALSGKTV